MQVRRSTALLTYLTRVIWAFDSTKRSSSFVVNPLHLNLFSKTTGQIWTKLGSDSSRSELNPMTKFTYKCTKMTAISKNIKFDKKHWKSTSLKLLDQLGTYFSVMVIEWSPYRIITDDQT